MIKNVVALPNGYRSSISQDIDTAIQTIEYVDRTYWTVSSGHAALREVMKVNFLEALIYAHNIIARMTGEDQLGEAGEPYFNTGWRREKLVDLTHDLNEARYLSTTRYLQDHREEFRIPAVQGLFRASYILRGIIEDFTKKAD